MANRIGSQSVEIVPDAQGFPEKVRAAIGDIPDIEVQLSIEEALARLDELQARIDELRDSATIDIDVDDLAAHAKIDELQARLDELHDQTVRVDVKDNGSSSAVGSSIMSAFNSAGIFAKAKIATIGEAILGLIPAAGAAAAAIAAISGAAVAVGAGALVAHLALSGVGDAYQASQQPSSGGGARSSNSLDSARLSAQSQQLAAQQATQSAADGLTSALQSQQQAEANLATAQRNAVQAQKDLTAARLAAKQ